jgi:hypothetical protein
MLRGLLTGNGRENENEPPALSKDGRLNQSG